MDIRKQAAVVAAEWSIPEGIFMGLIEMESSWNADAIGPGGTIGLTQMLPATAKALGYDPRELIKNPLLQLTAGGKYLHDMYTLFGRWDKALAAYNAGPHQVRRYNGVPPFKTTRNYVKKILDFAETYKNEL